MNNTLGFFNSWSSDYQSWLLLLPHGGQRDHSAATFCIGHAEESCQAIDLVTHTWYNYQMKIDEQGYPLCVEQPQ